MMRLPGVSADDVLQVSKDLRDAKDPNCGEYSCLSYQSFFLRTFMDYDPIHARVRNGLHVPPLHICLCFNYFFDISKTLTM